MKQTTSPAGIALLKDFEKCRLIAYLDAAKPPVWTCGWGHTGASVTQGLKIDQPRADAWLAADLLGSEEIVSRAVCVLLNDNQFSACVSLCYNTGPGAPIGKDGVGGKDGFVWLKARDAGGQPQHSTLLRRINAGRFEEAADEFPNWTHAGAADLAGLARRRKAERALFLGEIA
jgi:lysozyme